MRWHYSDLDTSCRFELRRAEQLRARRDHYSLQLRLSIYNLGRNSVYSFVGEGFLAITHVHINTFCRTHIRRGNEFQQTVLKTQRLPQKKGRTKHFGIDTSSLALGYGKLE